MRLELIRTVKVTLADRLPRPLGLARSLAGERQNVSRRRLNVLDTIAATLIDKDTGLFRWGDRDDRLDLYQTGLGWPLLTTTLDGFGVPAPWQQAFGKRRSETLFLALERISPAWTGFYIKHQDDAYAELSWARIVEAGTTLGVQILEEFSTNPRT